MSKFKRESAREMIRDAIIEGIYDGTYKAGDRIREKELAEVFGTSQAPVREALRELEGMLYVKTYPYKGTVIRKVTADDLAVAYGIRGKLEQLAAEVICRKAPRNWDDLRKIARIADEAAAEKDAKEYSAANVEFHKYIVDASEAAMLIHMWELVNVQTQVKNALEMIEITDQLAAFGEQHEAIIEALESCDGDLAGRLLYEHQGVVREWLSEE